MNTSQIAPIYNTLRQSILDLDPSYFPNVSKADNFGILGFLMETAYPQGIVTLVVLADGTTSLYFSSGGGILGSGEHHPVAEAGKVCLATADRYFAKMSPVKSLDLPKTGRVKFHLMTHSGLYSAGFHEIDLQERNHPFFELFSAAHQVITQIRLLQDSQQTAGYQH